MSDKKKRPISAKVIGLPADLDLLPNSIAAPVLRLSQHMISAFETFRSQMDLSSNCNHSDNDDEVSVQQSNDVGGEDSGHGNSDAEGCSEDKREENECEISDSNQLASSWSVLIVNESQEIADSRPAILIGDVEKNPKTLSEEGYDCESLCSTTLLSQPIVIGDIEIETDVHEDESNKQSIVASTTDYNPFETPKKFVPPEVTPRDDYCYRSDDSDVEILIKVPKNNFDQLILEQLSAVCPNCTVIALDIPKRDEATKPQILKPFRNIFPNKPCIDESTLCNHMIPKSINNDYIVSPFKLKKRRRRLPPSDFPRLHEKFNPNKKKFLRSSSTMTDAKAEDTQDQQVQEGPSMMTLRHIPPVVEKLTPDWMISLNSELQDVIKGLSTPFDPLKTDQTETPSAPISPGQNSSAHEPKTSLDGCNDEPVAECLTYISLFDEKTKQTNDLLSPPQNQRFVDAATSTMITRTTTATQQNSCLDMQRNMESASRYTSSQQAPTPPTILVDAFVTDSNSTHPSDSELISEEHKFSNACQSSEHSVSRTIPTDSSINSISSTSHSTELASAYCKITLEMPQEEILEHWQREKNTRKTNQLLELMEGQTTSKMAEQRERDKKRKSRRKLQENKRIAGAGESTASSSSFTLSSLDGNSKESGLNMQAFNFHGDIKYGDSKMKMSCKLSDRALSPADGNIKLDLPGNVSSFDGPTRITHGVGASLPPKPCSIRSTQSIHSNTSSVGTRPRKGRMTVKGDGGRKLLLHVVSSSSMSSKSFHGISTSTLSTDSNDNVYRPQVSEITGSRSAGTTIITKSNENELQSIRSNKHLSQQNKHEHNAQQGKQNNYFLCHKSRERFRHWCTITLNLCSRRNNPEGHN